MKNQGLRWTAYRAQYELKKKFRWLELQYPLKDFSELKVEGFNFNEIIGLFQIKKINIDSKVILKADNILENKFIFFSNEELNVDKVDWHFNYFTGKQADKNKHWSLISDLNSEFGDIKQIWELSRFPFAFTLAQAYKITGNVKYVRKFLDLFEDFYKHNPPEKGVNYKCGQEMSLRVFAIIYAVNLMHDSSLFTEKIQDKLIRLIIQHTRHIYKHINFSVESVKNNHSISEATALFVIGCLFSNTESIKWRNKGLRILEKEISWQIYDDGSYIQHSHNYHRLVIQNLTLAKIAANKKNILFSKNFLGKCKLTRDFLLNHCQESNGRLPNYGMNDGAYIFPLTSKDYLDYRPAINAFNLAYFNEYNFEGESNLDLSYWMGLKNKKDKYFKFERRSTFYENGGYLVSIKSNQQVTTRCTVYKHRPAQADMLHVDFWSNEVNVLTDAGTYSYNTDSERLKYFNGTKSHNSLFYDNKDQMTKGSRFIWYNWIEGKMLGLNIKNESDVFKAEHYGYEPVKYKRTITHNESLLIIEDYIENNSNLKNFEFNYLCGVSVQSVNKNEIYFEVMNYEQWKIEVISDDSLIIDLVKGQQSLYYNSYEELDMISLKVKPGRENTKIKLILKKVVG